MADKTHNHYEVLGLRRDATADEIKAAYRRRSKQHHPDLAPYKSTAERNAD